MWTQLCAFVLTTSTIAAQPSRLADYVDTRRGSDSVHNYSRGNTFPAATRPFGFNFWTPTTEPNSNSWLYTFSRTALQGFRVSHQPSPWMGDYGVVQFWPMSGALVVDGKKRQVTFQHSAEQARPYEYAVRLDNGIHARLIPTQRAAVLVFNYPKSAHSHLLVDGALGTDSALQLDDSGGVITGYTTRDGQRIYVHARLVNKAAAFSGISGKAGAVAWFTFPTTEGEEVVAHVGTSWLSVAQAEMNARNEIAGKTWQQVREEGAHEWDQALGTIDIEGGTDDQRTIFYASLYRAFMYPNARWESTPSGPRYFSPYNQRVEDGKMWVNNGFWDTYRAVWPLYYVLMPSHAAEMAQGFVRSYIDGGWTPRWSSPGYRDTMVGSHTDIVFADAMVRGIESVDYTAAYESAVKNATVFSPFADRGRKGNNRAPFLGYIPTGDIPEAGAWYLEDRINDYGIAQMAQLLGKQADYDYFINRARTYTNLFSPSVGFFRGKQADGSWRTSDADFRPNVWGFEFTEGCPWHYATAASFDPRGMANLYGGAEALSRKIDTVFAAPRSFDKGSYDEVIHEMVEAYDANMGQYAHANEPIMHMIYMYNYAGTPAKTQEHVRQVLNHPHMYTRGGSDGGGYLGDEDNGQMSAWYIFSALGFYPAAPGHPEYAIGSPLFDKATLHLEGGKTFTVVANHNSKANKYIQSAALNGAPLTANFLTHDAIRKGGTVSLEMGPKPSSWGSGIKDRPASLTQDDHVPAVRRDVAAATNGRSSDLGDSTFALALDDDSNTAWVATGSSAWMELHPANLATVSMYTLTSSSGGADHDPVNWALRGSNDGSNWTEIDARQNQTFSWRQQTRFFVVPQPRPFSHYRLELRSRSTEVLEVAEVELL